MWQLPPDVNFLWRGIKETCIQKNGFKEASWKFIFPKLFTCIPGMTTCFKYKSWVCVDSEHLTFCESLNGLFMKEDGHILNDLVNSTRHWFSIK